MIKIMKRKTYNKLQKDMQNGLHAFEGYKAANVPASQLQPPSQGLQKDMQNEVKDPIHEDTFSRWFNDWKNDNPLPVTCNDSVTKRNG